MGLICIERKPTPKVYLSMIRLCKHRTNVSVFLRSAMKYLLHHSDLYVPGRAGSRQTHDSCTPSDAPRGQRSQHGTPTTSLTLSSIPDCFFFSHRIYLERCIGGTIIPAIAILLLLMPQVDAVVVHDLHCLTPRGDN